MNIQEQFHNHIQFDKEITESLTTTREVKNKMATLKEEAMAYEPKTTMNIADLPEVPVDMTLADGSGTDSDGKEFSYKYAEFNGKEYRVPGVVLGEIKKMLKLKPDLEKVKVNRHGSGLSTRYEVEAI